MEENQSRGVSRRGVLGALATISAVAPFAVENARAEGSAAAPVASETGAPSPAAQPGAGYSYFGIEDAAFVEAMMDTMCPADGLTPSGTECGLAAFIDRQLAGAFGSGDRLYMAGPWKAGDPQQGYQRPLDPKSFFSAGILSTQRACKTSFEKSFQELSLEDRDRFLSSIAAGKVASDGVALAEWFNELVVPLFEQACFADPIYGGNRSKVFWKMIGYPGLPAFHALDVEKYRGKPYPGSAQPKSIQDFS